MNRKKSEALYLEAKKYIPGGVNSPVRAFKNLSIDPPFIKKGQGPHIYDQDNNKYIDYVMSWGPLITGHADADVVLALQKAINNGSSFGAPTELESALVLARKEQAADRYINKIFQKAIASAREIRHKTGLSEKNLSLSSLCVNYIESSFAKLSDKEILVIGVGEMSRIVLELLQEREVSKIFATNRTHGRLVKISDYFDDLIPIDYHRVHEIAANVDIIISSTSAPHYIIKGEEFKKHYKQKKISIFDLGLPRDIDPAIAEYNQIDLYNLDMLVEKIKENRKFRQQEAKKAEKLIEEEIIKIEEWYSWQEVVPLIKKMKKSNQDIIKKENHLLFDKLNLSEGEKKEIDKYSKRLEKELFNKIILNLKTMAKENQCEEIVDTFSKLFN